MKRDLSKTASRLGAPATAILVEPPKTASWFGAGEDSQVNWALEILELPPAGVRPLKTVGCAALSRLLRDLDQGIRENGPLRLEAIQILIGVPADQYDQACFRTALENEQLKQIDLVAFGYAQQLAEVGSIERLEQLGQQVRPWIKDASSAAVKQSVIQVMLVARKMGEIRAGEAPAVTALLQAIFQVSTTQPRRRQSIYRETVSRLKTQFTHDELKRAAVKVKRTYPLPEESFVRPFLYQLGWTNRDMEKFRLRLPKDGISGMASGLSNREKSLSDSRVVKLILVFFVVGVFIGIIRSQMRNDGSRYQHNTRPEIKRLTPEEARAIAHRSQGWLDQIKKNSADGTENDLIGPESSTLLESGQREGDSEIHANGDNSKDEVSERALEVLKTILQNREKKNE